MFRQGFDHKFINNENYPYLQHEWSYTNYGGSVNITSLKTGGGCQDFAEIIWSGGKWDQKKKKNIPI